MWVCVSSLSEKAARVFGSEGDSEKVHYVEEAKIAREREREKTRHRLREREMLLCREES